MIVTINQKRLNIRYCVKVFFDVVVFLFKIALFVCVFGQIAIDLMK
jgi:hypothetical protein